jgi:hypothetical protein
VGGGIALSSHGVKSATKLAANTSPEPFSNMALGFASDVASVGGAILMVAHPVLMVAVVIVATILSLLMARWIFRLLVRLFRSQPNASAA